MDKVKIEITGLAITARGTFPSGTKLTTDAAFAKHLVEDAKVAVYVDGPPALPGDSQSEADAVEARLAEAVDKARKEAAEQAEADKRAAVEEAVADIKAKLEAAAAKAAEMAAAEAEADKKAAVEKAIADTKAAGDAKSKSKS